MVLMDEKDDECRWCNWCINCSAPVMNSELFCSDECYAQYDRDNADVPEWD